MSQNREKIIISMLMIMAFILSACAQPPPQTIIETVVVEKEGETIVVTQEVIKTVEVEVPAPVVEPPQIKILYLSPGVSDPPTIDPSRATQVSEIQVVGSNSIGLFRQNEETAEVENGMATSYEVSEDGLVYTVKIKDDVPWVKWDPTEGEVVKVQDCEGKDRMVTAEDFKYGIMRTFDPLVAAEYAYIFLPYLKGAAEYNSAPVDDPAVLEEFAAGVGVEVVDPQTLKYTFIKPGVYNINLLGLWPTHAQPKWLIEGDDCTEAKGDRWIEQGFYQGYGPFTLKEWQHDYYMILVKNPYWPETAEVPAAKLDEVKLTFLDTTAAFAEYEAGNLDSASIPSGDMDRVMADPELSAQIEQVNELGTEFYAFNYILPPTDDVRVRKALSLAIDRQAIVENVNKSGITAQFFTNPGVAGAPKPENFPEYGAKFDPVAAKALMDEYLAEKGMTADQINITLLFNTTEMNKARAEVIQAMWKDTLGINVELINQERKVFLVQREEGKENVYRCSWVQDYPDANNFLYDTFMPGMGYNTVVRWSEGEEYELFKGYLEQAAVETDVEKRINLYLEAEKILVQDQAIVAPLYWYSTPVLYKPYVVHNPSITGYDHWEKWDLNK
jgi:oligopeptide transport system substrate-binding protein